jgi:hypothetical protein
MHQARLSDFGFNLMRGHPFVGSKDFIHSRIGIILVSPVENPCVDQFCPQHSQTQAYILAFEKLLPDLLHMSPMRGAVNFLDRLEPAVNAVVKRLQN